MEHKYKIMTNYYLTPFKIITDAKLPKQYNTKNRKLYEFKADERIFLAILTKKRPLFDCQFSNLGDEKIFIYTQDGLERIKFPTTTNDFRLKISKDVESILMGFTEKLFKLIGINEEVMENFIKVSFQHDENFTKTDFLVSIIDSQCHNFEKNCLKHPHKLPFTKKSLYNMFLVYKWNQKEIKSGENERHLSKIIRMETDPNRKYRGFEYFNRKSPLSFDLKTQSSNEEIDYEDFVVRYNHRHLAKHERNDYQYVTGIGKISSVQYKSGSAQHDDWRKLKNKPKDRKIVSIRMIEKFNSKKNIGDKLDFRKPNHLIRTQNGIGFQINDDYSKTNKDDANIPLQHLDVFPISSRIIRLFTRVPIILYRVRLLQNVGMIRDKLISSEINLSVFEKSNENSLMRFLPITLRMEDNFKNNCCPKMFHCSIF